MALSDLIRKIEDSPRSTKVAVVASGVAVAACAVAVLAVMDRNQYGPEPAESVAKVVTVAPTAQAVPAPTFTPVPTPSPVPTSTPVPSPTPGPVEEPTPVPTATPVLPTPTPEVNDYYVVLHQGRILNDGVGVIEYYAKYPFNPYAEGSAGSFYNEAFFLEYLRRKGVITSGQKNAYFNGEHIQIPLLPISKAAYQLFKNDNYNAQKLRIAGRRNLLHYGEEFYLDSGEDVSGGQLSLEGDGGYVTISDGKISVSAVDENGNTTTVNVEGVGAKELLDYWLSQNRITVDQANEYGQTRHIQISFQDAADLFDFDYSSSWASMGIDEEAQRIIVDEVLPLFKIGGSDD